MDKVISISVSRYLLECLRKYNVKVEELFVLLCYFEKSPEVLMEYLRGKTEDQQRVFMQPLVRKLLLTQTTDEEHFELAHYVPTDRAKSLYLLVEGQVTLEECTDTRVASVIHPHAEGAMGSVRNDIPTYEDFIRKYISYFPAGVKNGGNKSLRMNELDVRPRMMKFLEKYKYSWDVVLRATEAYMRGLRGNYTYCPTAVYFIMKDGVSALAAECERVLAGGEQKSSFDRSM